jgi:hypothetical protein
MVFFAVCALCLSACQATVQVGIDARIDGSGTVTATVLLDQAAAQALPDLAQELRVGDLQKDGWKIDGPSPSPGNGVQIRATKPFRSPPEAVRALGELLGTGPGGVGTGPFAGLRLEQHHAFLATKTALSGAVDLSCGLHCFGDAGLQQQTGRALGIDPAELQGRTGTVLDQVFRFELGARLPGTLRSTNGSVQPGGGLQWQPKLGGKIELRATSRTWNTRRLRLLGLSLLATVALIVLLIVRLVRRRRQRRGLHRRHRRLQLRRRLHIRRRRGGPSTPEKSEPNAPLVGAPH